MVVGDITAPAGASWKKACMCEERVLVWSTERLSVMLGRVTSLSSKLVIDEYSRSAALDEKSNGGKAMMGWRSGEDDGNGDLTSLLDNEEDDDGKDIGGL